MTRRIVVDASVASSCSISHVPPAPGCMAALEAVRESRLLVSVSAELKEEWERHQSRYFWRWLSRLTSSSRVKEDALARVTELRGRLRKLAGAAEGDAVAKDAHLAAAGIEHDGRVLSCDDAMRRKLARVAAESNWHELGLVHWADPSVDALDGLCAWLRSDAPDDELYRLRSRVANATRKGRRVDR